MKKVTHSYTNRPKFILNQILTKVSSILVNFGSNLEKFWKISLFKYQILGFYKRSLVINIPGWFCYCCLRHVPEQSFVWSTPSGVGWLKFMYDTLLGEEEKFQSSSPSHFLKNHVKSASSVVAPALKFWGGKGGVAMRNWLFLPLLCWNHQIWSNLTHL